MNSQIILTMLKDIETIMMLKIEYPSVSIAYNSLVDLVIAINESKKDLDESP